ncbi:MAG: TGS domain-containing protein, partial [Bacteroidales bacterium]
MIHITLPDNSKKVYEEPVTGYDIARDISPRLAKEVVSVSVNGEVQDLTRPIRQDARIVLHKFDSDEGKHAFWHSSAHLMAEALESLYPGVKFGIGPSIENGFYYDVDLGDDRTITDADLPRIEEKMIELARQKNEYNRKEVSK